jgi:hypothetical protein
VSELTQDEFISVLFNDCGIKPVWRKGWLELHGHNPNSETWTFDDRVAILKELQDYRRQQSERLAAHKSQINQGVTG